MYCYGASGMKAKELINELQKFDPELIVRIRDHCDMPSDECSDPERLIIEFDDERSLCDVLILETDNVD